MKQLSERIQNITEQAGGTWGIALEDLTTQATWQLNANESFYAASIIKVPIMIAVFDASHRGELSLSDTIALKREAVVGGGGVLQHMTLGTHFTIYDLVTMMIIQSDNTATNILIDLLGVERIQQTMKAIGMVTSKFYHKMMTIPVDREGLNEITPNEMTSMLKNLVTGKIISAHACGQMIAIMKKQQIRFCLPSKIREPNEDFIGELKEWELAHKTGNIAGVRHDIGIFYVGQRILIASVLSKGLDDIESLEYFGKIGLEIYHYLKGT